ncbi:MAG TPA: GNAT family N-acetyltransferase [Chloroflexota bacterium]|nr:GNAT family N-acetyltransferase [Chloroflexota bacterium]HUM71945.1 GNAT family N-acetyltransferase [Chloroflexota bacterium]
MSDKSFGLPRNLGDGLVLRWAKPTDAEELAQFNLRIHSDEGEQELFLVHWTKELMAGNHPTTKASDFTVVVDENEDGKIVSSLNLISQTWAYDGIPFGVGRPELVGTDEKYRRRGLVRAQFEAVHAKSAARGELVQVITGIPWYYRMYGYEMCVDLGGSRAYYLLPSRLRKTAENSEAEKYQIRPVTPDDVPALSELYARHCAGSLLSRVRDETIWQHELFHAHRETHNARFIYLITAVSDNSLAGYVEISPWHARGVYYVREMAAQPGYSLRALALFVIRHLERQAMAFNATAASPMECISFNLGTEHPVYQALSAELEKQDPPYSYYVRVPDMVAFLTHIMPVLERRLAESVVAGHTGQLRLNFYHSQLALDWENGRLTTIAPYQPKDFQDGHAFFPDQTFLQLLFGHRSLEELRHSRVDCSARNPDVAVLLDVLFPRRPSWVSPLG